MFVTSDISVTNAAAWRFLRTGTPYVPHSWINDATANEYHLIAGHWVADRMPGMILSLTPFQWFGGPKPGIIGFMILGFIATAITVYSVQWLWGFFPAVITCIACPLLAMNKEVWPQTLLIPTMLIGFIVLERWQHVWTIAPLTFYAFIVRPPFAVCLALVFIMYAYLRPRVAVYAAVGLATGAVFLLVWTHAYFGFWSLAGGYSIDGHHHVPLSHSLYVGFLSPQRGILFYSPWAIVVLTNISLRAKAIALLVLLYTVAEWQQYNAFGGDGFLGYRYPLPFIVLLVPLIVVKWNSIYAALVGWSIGVCSYIFFYDRLQWNNPGRNPNFFPMPIIYWGIACLIASYVSSEILRVRRIKSNQQESQSVLSD